MKIYNTLTGKKEEFVPLTENKVKMYVCGPTVYNLMHIGNARPCVVFDAFRRYLLYKGYDVFYVQNFTDVDDKIIQKANVEGVSAQEVSERYINEFFADVAGLNTIPASKYPRVTEEMDGIVQMIGELIKSGHAYEKNGSVYFSVDTKDDYGKLSKKNIDDLEAGSRVEVNEEKLNSMDFVLWKPAKPNEPKWQSPWSEGRPGWHIECSVMAKKYLGDSIDIHAGGEDLIFPHHENEIAQSESANGKSFAKYWMHNAMINIDNKKMSKSRGNFFTLRDLSEKYSYEMVRFLILSVHYRSPFNLNSNLLEAAQNGFERIRNCRRTLQDILKNSSSEVLKLGEVEIMDGAKRFVTDFENAMEDDCNTANAVTAVFELVKYINTGVSDLSSKKLAAALLEKLELLCGLLGFDFKENNRSADDSAIETLIEKRQKARKEKDWAESDRIRDELMARGIVLKDTPEGVKWHHKGN